MNKSWAIVAVIGLGAFILAFIMGVKKETPEHQSPEHMERMRKAKAEKAKEQEPTTTGNNDESTAET